MNSMNSCGILPDFHGMAEPAVFDIAHDEGSGGEVERWLEELGLGRYFGLLQAPLKSKGYFK